ncbi:MAG: ATP-dependent DNA helicase RecQ [Bacteroidia bacterium]
MTIQQLLTKYWGFTTFRPLQEDIINSVLAGNDTLALLPTGGGKSVCFQIPSLAKNGICIVVSPLIALMKDQVESLKKKGIKAMSIVSGMSAREVDIALDNAIFGDYKFLYLSPERLSSEMVRMRIEKMNVNLFAIDEAHCISQWGYDFRPPYLRLSEIRELHPQVPVLALTATATPPVQKDIQQKLHFKKENIFIKSFERKNISYIVLYNEDKFQKTINILNKVNGTAIIYVRNRKKTKEIADLLLKNKISADFYHAGLTTSTRNEKQLAWINNKTRVIVATNAFGMGIDKPDVRTVIHLDLPDSPEAYYQEAGRGGRDEKSAYAVIFYSEADRIEMEKRVDLTFPSVEQIKNVYHAIANYLQVPTGTGQGVSYNFNVADFCNHYKLHALRVFNCIKILELEDYISLSDSAYLPSRLHFTVNNMELYKFQVQQPAYDYFIKTILRSYEGVFDDFVKINEKEISTRSGIEIEQVIKNLNYLKRLGLLNYEPQTDKSQLVFTQPRVGSDEVMISKEHLADRKKRFVERANSVLRYVESLHKCRSMMLLNYFGEKTEQRCGSCDYCRERNKLELNEIEFSGISEKVKVLTTQRALTLQNLITDLKIPNDDKAIKAIQWMLDNDQLRYVNGEELKWMD